MITDSITKARVMSSGRVLVRQSEHDDTHSLEPDLRERISNICGEGGLVEFLKYHLTREILLNEENTKVKNLTSISRYNDPLTVAKRLVTDLANLPEKLRVISPLPHVLARTLFGGLETLDLSGGVMIVRGDLLKKNAPLSTGSKKLDERVVRITDIGNYSLDENTYFFVTFHSGFAGNFFGNPAIIEHSDKLRSMLGCLLAISVLEDDYIEDDCYEQGIIVHNIVDKADPKLTLTSRTDADISAFFENHGFDWVSEFDYEEDDIDNISEDQMQETLGGIRENVARSLRIVFSSDDHARRLFTSSLWIFRSVTTTRKMDEILYATISLEVILGDRETADRIGLTKLLANRCAYLLGKSRKEREDIIGDFKMVYDIRSQIVHAGLHHLGKEADRAASLARGLAARVLRQEIALA